jgi:hypothetical protein
MADILLKKMNIKGYSIYSRNSVYSGYSVYSLEALALRVPKSTRKSTQHIKAESLLFQAVIPKSTHSTHDTGNSYGG